MVSGEARLIRSEVNPFVSTQLPPERLFINAIKVTTRHISPIVAVSPLINPEGCMDGSFNSNLRSFWNSPTIPIKNKSQRLR